MTAAERLRSDHVAQHPAMQREQARARETLEQRCAPELQQHNTLEREVAQRHELDHKARTSFGAMETRWLIDAMAAEIATAVARALKLKLAAGQRHRRPILCDLGSEDLATFSFPSWPNHHVSGRFGHSQFIKPAKSATPK